MSTQLKDRRQFLYHLVLGSSGMMIGSSDWLPFLTQDRPRENPGSEPLFDWTLWEKYRSQIHHPCLTFKEANVDLAHKNIARFPWAENYARNIERAAFHHIHLTDRIILEKLIEETTPGDPLWTPCPACRDQGKPVHPHGLWKWEIQNYHRLECEQCGTVFPNAKYPETISMKTTWGKPQELTYYGGDPFKIFGFTQGRPSFLANIRSQKVQWCAGYARMLAEAYALTKKSELAVACKKILLRFATCYPNWLVHVGYGEYADMDPRVAALHIAELPHPEITPPPNQPNGGLWTAYWSAGRASGVGLESDFIRKVVEAYDMTCAAVDENGEGIYQEEDRIRIERDLLLESTILLVCDKKLNNKSVSNRTAVALVGMCVGHPDLFRFGMEGFSKTVNEWFLQDGTSSESPFYGLMTLGGIWDFAQASKGYSDPAGFLDRSGNRIDSFDAYREQAYTGVLHGFFRGLQGDLKYPPYADSFKDLGLDASYVDLMVANYPDKPEYLALLKELCGEDLSLPSGPVDDSYFSDAMEEFEMTTQSLPYDLAKPNSPSSFSLFFRNPGNNQVKIPSLHFSDWCPPDLRIGHMRTGTDGRESLLLLTASHWGIHHERDSLHIYYWKKGRELLSDLGYLWDHPLKPQTIRTVAHNTVVVNESDQRTQPRGGNVVFFRSSPQVKVMEATSEAYAEAQIYRRTVALVEHGNGKNYAVDFFRAEGGDTRDYVFHLSSLSYELSGLTCKESGIEKLYDFSQIQQGSGSDKWNICWPVGSGMLCRAWALGSAGEDVFFAKGWGQRDWKNSDVGAQIPYVIRRHRGDGLNTFISVFEGFESDQSFVRDVRVLDDRGIIAVDTEEGTDYIASSFGAGIDPISYETGTSHVQGRFGVVSTNADGVKWKFEVE